MAALIVIGLLLAIAAVAFYQATLIPRGGNGNAGTQTHTLKVDLDSATINKNCQSAVPLPGWKNCTGTVGISINGFPQSQYISVYLAYGDTGGSFYHGQAPVSWPSVRYVIPITNDYEATCVPNVSTTLDVRAGPESDPNAPLLASIPTSFQGGC